MLATTIPPLYWFVQPERQEFAVQILQGQMLFCFFSSEARALDYQGKVGLGSDWQVWGNDTAEYVLRVLDASARGFDVYAIDPPPVHGEFIPTYTLEEMKDTVRRKAEEGGAW
jgi:hypothetical protein